MHVSSRRKTPLDGEWGFEVDPYDAGTPQRIWECRKEAAGGRPEDFDVRAFRHARVPGDWNRQFSDLSYYKGI
ncbi:MAG: hypothetical protein ACYSU0_17290, partial [Planctomycetota bacterium]